MCTEWRLLIIQKTVFSSPQQCFYLYWFFWFSDVRRDEGQRRNKDKKHRATWGVKRNNPADNSVIAVLSFPSNSLVITILTFLDFLFISWFYIYRQCRFMYFKIWFTAVCTVWTCASCPETTSVMNCRYVNKIDLTVSPGKNQQCHWKVSISSN